MELERYLERIEYDGAIEVGSATLFALQKAHALAVPFENLDVQLGRRLTICIEEAYDKIVLNSRGGWCYEQNGLFGWALTEIGFNVTRISASVMRQEKGDESSASHLCLLVDSPESNTRFLVDVGFGGSMIKPIPLQEGQYDQPPFKLGLEKLNDGYWRFWEDPGSGKFSFDFTENPASESALAEKCASFQSDPKSHFLLNLVAQKRTGDQHRMLRGRVFSVAKASGMTTETVESPEMLVSMLKLEFRLDVREIGDLWPRITARHQMLFDKKSS